MNDQESEISDGELEAILARVKATTPGPWVSFLTTRDKISGSDFIQTAGEDLEILGGSVADLEFIAHARQDIPRLVGEILRLRKSLKEK